MMVHCIWYKCNVIGFGMLLGSQCGQPSKLAVQNNGRSTFMQIPCSMPLDIAIEAPSLPLHDFSAC